jgi:acetyl-CoA carboxylase biotin carboxyl carrier protein
MPDHKAQIDTLASLMQEFRLSEATLQLDGFGVTLRRQSKPVTRVASEDSSVVEHDDYHEEPTAAPVAAAPAGMPINSPMTGIYYSAPSPGSPVFVKVGDEVTAGQVIGLIEAMKVFNEIPSPMSGTVVRIVAEAGTVVQHGDPILFVE